MTDLNAITALFAAFSDPTRVRLMTILAQAELSVAELTRVTGIPQSRVSSHLARLREAGLTRDRRSGTSTFYRLDVSRMPVAAQRTWDGITAELDDDVVAADRLRCEALVRQRRSETTWPDDVAGQMEHHYSPGRTWEATARAFVGLIQLGDVLDLGSGDGVIAQLLAPRARTYTCLDRSAKVIAAAQQRLGHLDNVTLIEADMAHVPAPDQSFDQVLLFSVLPYTLEPAQVLAESHRVLRQGGTLIVVTLDRHCHVDVSDNYDHLNHGFTPQQVRQMLADAHFVVHHCERTVRERRKPYFDVVTAFASRSNDLRSST